MSFIKTFKEAVCSGYILQNRELIEKNNILALENDRLKTIPIANINPEDYWNNLYTKSHVTYEIRPGKIIDIRAMQAVSLETELEMRKIAQQWEGKNPDDIALSVLKYVISKLTYKSDNGEYWQTIDETWKLKTGDCEDGMNLLCALLRFTGISAWRRECYAGDVKINEFPKLTGHAFIVYIANDNKEYVLDWCFYPNESIINFKKKPLSELERYEDSWFSYNEQYAWKSRDFKK